MRALWPVVGCGDLGCEGFVVCGSVDCEGFVALFKDMSGCVALFMALWECVSLYVHVKLCACGRFIHYKTVIRRTYRTAASGEHSLSHNAPVLVLK